MSNSGKAHKPMIYMKNCIIQNEVKHLQTTKNKEIKSPKKVEFICTKKLWIGDQLWFLLSHISPIINILHPPLGKERGQILLLPEKSKASRERERLLFFLLQKTTRHGEIVIFSTPKKYSSRRDCNFFYSKKLLATRLFTQ